MPHRAVPARTPSVRNALRISWLSIGWSALSGSLTVVLGVFAGSLALIGAGVIVLIDMTSSAVLIWRFTQHHEHPTAEQRAHRIATGALFALALALLVGAVLRLSSNGVAHPGPIATAANVAGVVVLPFLAVGKYRAARDAGSRALRADAHITVVGTMTNLISLVGLALTRAGWNQADAVAALIVGSVAALVGAREAATATLHRPRVHDRLTQAQLGVRPSSVDDG